MGFDVDSELAKPAPTDDCELAQPSKLEEGIPTKKMDVFDIDGLLGASASAAADATPAQGDASFDIDAELAQPSPLEEGRVSIASPGRERDNNTQISGPSHGDGSMGGGVGWQHCYTSAWRAGGPRQPDCRCRSGWKARVHRAKMARLFAAPWRCKPNPRATQSDPHWPSLCAAR